MNTMDTIKSMIYFVAGTVLIIVFAGKLLMQFLFMLIGLYLINEGLKMRGFSSTSFFMKLWMGRGLR